ncbi:MAG: hypothetical protein A2Y07_07425 [Planctomycetes bacterium GWF2_50_10]|nr:MAG: hypothetical protein A2Y07_07425 [Planctomycetes bacterium GWF2_50_10]
MDSSKPNIFSRIMARLACRSASVIIFAALGCTILVKSYSAIRFGIPANLPSLIINDLAVLIGLELAISLAYRKFPSKFTLRLTLLIAACICTYALFNAGYLIATGTQILPAVIWPLIRDPLNTGAIVGTHLLFRPIEAVLLLSPAACALAMFISWLIQAQTPVIRSRTIKFKSGFFAIFAAMAGLQYILIPPNPASAVYQLAFNCHVKAVFSISADLVSAFKPRTFKPPIPYAHQINIKRSADLKTKPNVILIILEGVQYQKTSLAGDACDLTPNLDALARTGIHFANARTVVTHTSKSVFAMHTGRYSSVSQDLVEAVPSHAPYASLATIHKSLFNSRTAFFQSAKGNFEARPALAHNLGFEKFFSRDKLDPNTYLGYLSADEFALLDPISDWLRADKRPFMLTVLCSVTHDPYEIPASFCPTYPQTIDRYKRTIQYTDAFIAAFVQMLENLNLRENTILCIVGDHGEAFGEHDAFAHDRLAFEEVLRIVWVINSPLVNHARIETPASSIDLTPTLLGLMGCEVPSASFDGQNILSLLKTDRKCFFSGWILNGPAGYVTAERKKVIDPITKIAVEFDLASDPGEIAPILLDKNESQKIFDEVNAWQRSTWLTSPRNKTGQVTLYDDWIVRYAPRNAAASLIGKNTRKLAAKK